MNFIIHISQQIQHACKNTYGHDGLKPWLEAIMAVCVLAGMLDLLTDSFLSHVTHWRSLTEVSQQARREAAAAAAAAALHTTFQRWRL
jgi:hypothetical protein